MSAKEKKTEQKSIPTNRIVLPLLFIGFSIIMEIVCFIYFGFKSVDGTSLVIPKYFIFDLAIILIIAGVIFLCQNKVLQNIVYFFFISLQIILNIVNTTMYNIFGDILSYDAIFLMGEAATTLTVEYVDWWGVVINLIFLAVVIAVSVILRNHNKREFIFRRKFRWALILAIFVFTQGIGASLLAIQIGTLQTADAQESVIETSDEYLWDNFQFKLDAYKKFGHFGFYAKSIYNIAKSYLIKEDYSDIPAQIDAGYNEENPSATLYGDNLMVVLCESLEWYAIDQELTPTLYSLAYAQNENAISFTNFHGRNRTNISEGITLLGSMPRNTIINNAKQKGYTFDYALPKLFKSTATNLTTKANYFHQNNDTFYHRNNTHGASGLGFDDLYTYEDYTGESDFSWGKLLFMEDYEFSSNQIDNIFPTDCDRFLTYYASLSTHGEYTNEQPALKKYYSVIDDNWDSLAVDLDATCGEGTAERVKENSEVYRLFKHYKAGAIDLDRTVAMWIQELKDRGLHDNTTIVFFADHNAYASSLCYHMKGIEKTEYSSTKVNNIPMFIYSPHLSSEIGSGTNNVFCNTYDILPTICDLYGLPTNTTLFQGYSIYSDDIQYSFFASNLNGMFTDKLYSQNISEIYMPNGYVSDEEVRKFKEYANKYFEKQYLLEKIFTNGINGTINCSGAKKS